MNKKVDVIIVGTGMGGATTGYALAKAGLKVLFLEKAYSGYSQKWVLFQIVETRHALSLQSRNDR